MERTNQLLLWVIAIVFTLLFSVCMLVWVQGERENGTRQVNDLVEKFYQEGAQESYRQDLSQLEALTVKTLLKDEDRIRAYMLMSTIYICLQDYPNAVKSSVDAIYSAKRSDHPSYVAKSYLQLSDAFIQFGDYDLAENLVMEAFDGRKESQEDDRWIQEFGYINLAEIRVAERRNDEARRYLKMSAEFSDDKAENHQYVHQARQLLLAQTYWNEGNSAQARLLLDAVDAHQGNTELWRLYVQIPALELASKLSLETGDEQTVKDACDRVIEAYRATQRRMKEILYVAEMMDLFKERYPDLYHAYQRQQLKNYPQALKEANRLTAKFLFSAHSEGVSYHLEKSDRITMCVVVLICCMIFILLAWVVRLLYRQNHLDALTGIYNRRFFTRSYAYYCYEGNFAVIMIDIDHFKAVNDCWGHSVGDEVLCSVVAACRRCLPEGAKIFRFGGEEFCVLYKTAYIKEAVQIAQHMRAAVENLKWEQGFNITISLGVAHSAQCRGPLKRADENLYRSKAAGRNRVTFE